MERHIECGSSGASTPHSIVIGAAKRPRISSSSPHRPRQPLRDNDISTILNYGSEEDSEDDGENDDFTTSPMVPRAARFYFQEEDDDVVKTDAIPSIQWPPQSQQPQQFEAVLPIFNIPDPKPTTNPEPTTDSEPITEPEPTTELQPSSKFVFNWRAFSQPQIPPELRREPFSDILWTDLCSLIK
ncbi:unnamed protein product [Parnassius apollo]|uniref:(apollo) hypothetical protein n=1 Tax=Parnassius apollo TaxID=110799 RepID=A0A8S3YAA7_PARAO|nr:unnamed protein product [Parnassius apollo]